MKYLKSLLYTICLTFFIVHVPSVHRHMLRNYVASKSVTVTFTDGRWGGGSGVHVKLPHGGNAILTNAHVCAIKDEHNEVLIGSESLEKPIPRRVIEVANYTDLCLIEGLPGVTGLSLGGDLYAGDIVNVIGHPLLQPITMTSGEVTSEGPVDIADYIIDTPEEEAKCNLPKNKILTFKSIFGNIEVCAIHLEAVQSTAQIFPGNSGSGVVDSRGRLVGVAFASSEETHWGMLITLEDIRHFLYPY